MLAIISLISGSLAFLGSGCCCVPIVSLIATFAVPLLALVAVVTGIVGIVTAGPSGRGRGMAYGGIGLGIVDLLIGVTITLLAMFAGVGMSALQNM